MLEILLMEFTMYVCGRVIVTPSSESLSISVKLQN